MSMKTQLVKTHRNNTAVTITIPHKIAKRLNINYEDILALQVEGNKLIFSPTSTFINQPI